MLIEVFVSTYRTAGPMGCRLYNLDKNGHHRLRIARVEQWKVSTAMTNFIKLEAMHARDGIIWPI